MELVVLLVIVIGVIAGLMQSKHQAGAKAQLDRAMSGTSRGAPAISYTGSDHRTGLSISEDGNSIKLFTLDGNSTRVRTAPCTELLGAEVFEDGDTIISSSRARTIGGALVGGALLGGAGVVLGGLSGKKRSTATVRRIELRISLNDMRAPLFTVVFLDSEQPRTSILYDTASRNAREWHGRIGVLMKRAERMGAPLESRDERLDRLRQSTREKNDPGHGEHRLDID